MAHGCEPVARLEDPKTWDQHVWPAQGFITALVMRVSGIHIAWWALLTTRRCSSNGYSALTPKTGTGR